MILNESLDAYLRRLVERYDEPILVSMEEHAAGIGFPIVGRLCGIALELLARSVRAKRVFELGSGFGYSAYWFGRAVGADGELHLTDRDTKNRALAEDFLTRAGMWDRVTYHVDDALKSFALVGGEFDVVFCDADKPMYPDLWRAARSRIRVGGMWIADNVLVGGTSPNKWTLGSDVPDDDRARAVDEHNHLVAEDRDYVATFVPMREGLIAALRIR
jgi:predicted O-methyltransferase YrrM